jgi:hypothetical protein
VKFPDYLRRIPGREHARGKISLNDRPGGHYRVIPDFASRQHHNAMAEPDVGSDDDWSGLQRVVWVHRMIVRVIYCREWANLGIIANFDITGRRNASTLVDKNPIADFKPGIWYGGSDFTTSDASPSNEPLANFDLSFAIQHRQASIARHERRPDSMRAKPGSADCRFKVKSQTSLHQILPFRPGRLSGAQAGPAEPQPQA